MNYYPLGTWLKCKDDRSNSYYYSKVVKCECNLGCEVHIVTHPTRDTFISAAWDNNELSLAMPPIQEWWE